MEPDKEPDFDAIVIGTGFAGAVTACRLTEAGLSVCVLERGRRYEKDDFPVHPKADIPSVGAAAGPRERPNPDPYPLFWMLGHGMWDVRDLGEIAVAQAAGYGGGSLFYANVHLRAPAEAFAGWPDEYRKEELDPYYDLAAYMLDVQPLPKEVQLAKTARLEGAAADLGRPCFRPPLAVNFAPAQDGMTENRFGRMQGGCQLRGDCCFGCGAMAKNTLDLNYLALAEDARTGDEPLADIRTLAEVVSIEQREDGSYTVEYRDLNAGAPDAHEAVAARHVFLCAGAVNSTELLLRNGVAGKLPCPEQDLGTGFYPNADSIAVAFDCEDLQEADRGPTITSALLYDDGKHWFLFEDGGMPTDLEPFLGVFRSPLWLGRNRFWEDSVPPNSATPPRVGYATLPFHSLSEQLVSLLPGAIQTKSPQLREVAEAVVAISRGLRRSEWLAGAEERGLKQWGLLPDQLIAALGANRDELSEQIVAAAEPFVAQLLQRTASIIEETVEKKGSLESLLEKLPLPAYFDVSGIQDKDRELAARILRLGVQLVWGSQGGMIRDVAAQLLEFSIPEQGQILERATDLLRWGLDFRLSDSHTGVLLCMGRDSDLPGTLSINVPEAPPVGSTVRGEDSNAAGILVSSALGSGSWALNDAAGTLTLAKLQERFRPTERMLVGQRVIGTVVSDEIELTPGSPVFPPDASASAGNDTLKLATEQLRLSAIRFHPAGTSTGTKAAARKGLPGARLRARLPGPLQTPQRTTQERMLRDIVSEAWRGELRTDPISAFMRRRLTVHSQGGCPMDRVTRPDGEVSGCPGLYVMDAAAFPKSVGVNPSATILAVAEYKVEQFIRRSLKNPEWRAHHFEDARSWMKESGRRDELDPLKSRHPRGKPPESKPIGIHFKETMTGRCGATPGNPGHEIEVVLEAEIDDLASFLECHERGGLPEIAVWGDVEFTPPLAGAPQMLAVRRAASHIHLFRKASAAVGGRETRTIEYRLVLDGKVQSYVIEGSKTLRDDDDFDLWKDASRLDFKLKQGGTALCEGVLRLTASAFYGEQLRSFEATNTKDPIRQIWALTAFGKFFFGQLADIYVPELEALGDVAKCIAERTHV